MSHLRGSHWLNFPRVANETWVQGNIVLVGDAAHSAHFSIGSGTKLALEDAIALARAFDRMARDVPAALAAYETERKIDVLRIQSAARNSTEWFENVARYAQLRAGAIRLFAADPQPAHQPRESAAARPALAGGGGALAGRARRAIPPTGRSRRCSCRSGCATCGLANRIVVSPMATYSAQDGMPNDFHLVHLGARALGGAGLVFTEMVCVTPEGRITPGCAGLWSEAQMAAWARIVEFVHQQSAAKICLQLGHSGPKGSTQLGWEEIDAPLRRRQLGVDRALADSVEPV